MPPINAPLPTRVVDVDQAWLQHALGQSQSSVTVRHAEVREVIPGTSTKIRVALAGDGGCPESVIVKGGFEAHSPRMAPLYRAEAQFYADVQPLISMRSPRCYFAGSDPSSHQSIVILEDLRRPGVKFLDPLRPLGFDAVKRRLQAMAIYHAETWNSPMFAPGGAWAWVGSKFSDWASVYAEHYLAPDRWDQYMASPRGAAVSTRFHDAAWMRRALRRLGEIEAAEPLCLIHGDTHLGNLYEDAGGAPGFFDAQVARAHWSNEVSYHLVAALDPADRRKWEEPLLAIYLEALSAQGVRAPGLDEAHRRYAESIANGLFIFLINQTEFQTEAVNTAYAARFGAAALDHDLRDLLD